ncbi:uncharacterized protein TNCV_4756361 [Trichonephila clavipes]|nr:uncharacterized protein TNCV_4756361 [Trichonephila clavipes]
MEIGAPNNEEVRKYHHSPPQNLTLPYDTFPPDQYRSLKWHYFPRWRPIYQLSSDLFSVWFANSSKRSSSKAEITVVPDFHKRILFSDEAHFWLNGYVNKQNCRIWSEANPQVYIETPLHPEKLTVWCALWAGGILLQKG